MSTLLHPHVTCVWSDIPIGLGTRVRTFKPSMKLSKQLVNASIIFITSIIPGSLFRSLDNSTTQVLLSFLDPLDLWSLVFLNALSLWQFGRVCPWNPQWWHKWFILGPLCNCGRDFSLAVDLTTDWLQDLLNSHWSATFFFFSTFSFSTVEAPTVSSLAFTNFTSLEMFTAELLSSVYPNPILSEKVFWEERTSSSFFVETRSTLAFAWITSSSRNFTLV